MKYRSLWIIVVFSITALGFSFFGSTEMPEPEGEAFWTYIAETHPYTEWDQWPGHTGMHPGQSPHGAFLKVYVNNAAKKAIEDGKMMMPEGAIVVKENYAKDKETLAAVTPMYKAEGFNPDAGNWFWAKYKADGSVLASGKVEGCIDCHSKVKDKDWLFTWADKEEMK